MMVMMNDEHKFHFKFSFVLEIYSSIYVFYGTHKKFRLFNYLC